MNLEGILSTYSPFHIIVQTSYELTSKTQNENSFSQKHEPLAYYSFSLSVRKISKAISNNFTLQLKSSQEDFAPNVISGLIKIYFHLL